MNEIDLVRHIVKSNLRVANAHNNAYSNLEFYTSRLISDIKNNLAHVNIQNDIKHIRKALRGLPYPYCELYTKDRS
jgi:hypothetical protein